jgi:hypothetical protein
MVKASGLKTSEVPYREKIRYEVILGYKKELIKKSD